MSIAVSAVVRPSRLLLVGLMAAAGSSLLLAVVVALGAVGDSGLPLRATVSAACAFLGVFGLYHGIKCRKPIHISISGDGQFRLTDISSPPSCGGGDWPHLQVSATRVRLLSNSTLWPHLLLLRFRDEGGKTLVVPILPDSVSRDSFRALAVACRWAALQPNRESRNVRIR